MGRHECGRGKELVWLYAKGKDNIG